MTSSELPPKGRFKPYYILPGTSIGKYVVLAAIGRGGSQMAYLARDPNWHPVVVKVGLFPRGETGTWNRMRLERDRRQAQYFLQLSDVPAVARIYEYGMHPDNSEDGYPYLVQEWVWDGINIVDWFRRKPLPLEILVEAWMYLADACGAMESRGICHRDLKPENILMPPTGIPKIVDFDSGMSVGAAPLTIEGPGGWFPGTPSYYSPEMCKAILAEWANPGQQEFDYRPACDLHALGVIFYEMLTGKHPFDEKLGNKELFRQIASEVPKLPHTLNPDVPFALEKVTMKLLQKEPEKRYQTGYELVRDLDALLETSEDWKRLFQTPGGTERSTSTTPSDFWTSHSTPGAPPHAPGPSAGPVDATEEEAGARETGAPRPEAERATSRRFRRRDRFWKYIAISGGAGGLIASLVFVLFLLAQRQPDRALATCSAATEIVILRFVGDGSLWWFERKSMLAMSEWGEKMPKRPAEQQVPPFTLPGQKVAPCDEGLGAEAINGNCWVAVRNVKPPCGRTFRHGDICYLPVAADPKRPVEPGPDRLRVP